MTIGVTNGNGGTNLNFKVLGSSVRPVSARENTIWIKTDTPIRAWSFRPDAPSPVEGMVWLTIGASSPVGFNALRKNKIMILPTAAQQYIDGKWKNMEAYAYIGGTWVQFSNTRVYLYHNGIISDEVGGAIKGFPAHYSDTNGYAPKQVVNYSDGHIGIFSFTKYGSGAAYFIKPIDLTPWRTVYIDGAVKSRDATRGGFGFVKNTSDLLPLIAMTAQNTNKTRTIHKIDVSSLSGNYYLGFGGHMYDDLSGDIWEIFIE
jgi:hypothetical protein